VSEDLITSIAKAGNGKYEFVKNLERELLKEKAIKLIHSSISPFLQNFEISLSNNFVVKETVPRPEKIPFILKNEPFRLYMLLEKDFSNIEKLEVEFSYETSETSNPKKMKFTLSPSEAIMGDKIHKMAVKQIIDNLEIENRN